MSDDIPLELPEAEDEDVEQLYALIAAGLWYETLLARVRAPAESAARLQDAVRGRQD